MNNTDANMNNEIEYLIRELKSTYTITSSYQDMTVNDELLLSTNDHEYDDIIDIGIEDHFDSH